MPSKYRYEEWAKCQTCGFDVPRTRIRRHPRFGWQCIGAPGANCFDYGPHYDEVQRPTYRNEGVRTTIAPPVRSLTEGQDSLSILDIKLFDHSVPSNTYVVHFGETITVNLSTGHGSSGISIDGQHVLFIRNSELIMTATSMAGLVPLPPDVSMFINANGEIEYEYNG